MLVPIATLCLFLLPSTTSRVRGSPVKVSCQSCVPTGDRLRGRVGETITVQYNISNPDNSLLRFTIWYNNSHEIIVSMEHKPPKVTSNRFDHRIPKASVNSESKFVSVFVTLQNLTMADNGLKFQYRMKLKSDQSQGYGFNSLSVERFMVERGSAINATIVVIAVVLSVCVAVVILVAVVARRWQSLSACKCNRNVDVEKNPGPPHDEPPVDPPPRSNRTSAAALLAEAPDELDGYQDLNQIDNVSYTEIDGYAAPDDANKYLPASVFKMGMDSSAADDLLSACGTPGVYIVRKGRDGRDVLSAFLLNETKHYKIFIDGEEMYLRSDQPKFVKLVHLLQYYHENNLPTCHARLERPYADSGATDGVNVHYQNVRDFGR